MTSPRTATRPARDVAALAALFAASGTVHLARPEFYLPIVPEAVPAPRQVVVWSGVAEILCAAALWHPRTRRAAGWASVGILVGVYPANIKMARDARRSRRTALKVGTVVRLPLQLPMIRTALRAARG